MATASDIARLRGFVDEPTEESWTDVQLGDLIDSLGGTDAAAYEIWTRKAASYSTAVDITEAGSSRKNSELHTNALRMAGLFEARSSSETAGSGRVGTRVSKIRRR